MLVPVRRKPVAAFVVGHGYGGRTAPVTWLPVTPAVAIFPCAPGFNLSEAPGIPARKSGHVLHGITDRATYILRHCVASLWSAATVILKLFPDLEGRIYYTGGSFGGGLGALALPWDNRFRRAHLSVPTFGHHPIRLTCASEGSGEFVRQYARSHPEVTEVLAYFDAATAASKIGIPVLGSPALFDPKVPPPGQWAVCNALNAESKTHRLSAGHFTYPAQSEERAELEREMEQWFASDTP